MLIALGTGSLPRKDGATTCSRRLAPGCLTLKWLSGESTLSVYRERRKNREPLLSDFLEKLESPDCSCQRWSKNSDGEPIPAPVCDHVRNTPVHNLSCEQWAALLLEAYPSEYADKPLPTPAVTLTLQARVALMARRQRRGQALFHPHDTLPPNMADRLGVVVHNLRNGVTTRGGEIQ